jgi:hypothetical protein
LALAEVHKVAMRYAARRVPIKAGAWRQQKLLDRRV